MLASIVCAIIVTTLLIMELILIVNIGLLIVHVQGSHALVDGRVIQI